MILKILCKFIKKVCFFLGIFGYNISEACLKMINGYYTNLPIDVFLKKFDREFFNIIFLDLFNFNFFKDLIEVEFINKITLTEVIYPLIHHKLKKYRFAVINLSFNQGIAWFYELKKYFRYIATRQIIHRGLFLNNSFFSSEIIFFCSNNKTIFRRVDKIYPNQIEYMDYKNYSKTNVRPYSYNFELKFRSLIDVLFGKDYNYKNIAFLNINENISLMKKLLDKNTILYFNDIDNERYRKNKNYFKKNKFKLVYEIG